MKDLFYQQILAGLAGPLDPQVFERCMGDLLRDTFPGLVPVPGGNDAGMDGAIADGSGEPFPLVCTTEDDVIGNLTGSLDAFLKRGLSSRKVALATSQSLTPLRQRNLFERAREKGFTMAQVIDQRGVADRLYRNSRWCKELLGLSGTPSALSVVPPTRRPLIDLEPIGREADLEWLRTTSGDRVLSGQPGSGKTFLAYHLMRNGWNALFLASTDEVANAIRDQKPEVIVVDDAHSDPDRLVDLVRLRREIAADFSILAMTWEGSRDQVAEALGGVPAERIRKLELLTRDEILKVIREVGVEARDEVLRDLVDQAANKPGLAVTIAMLWLQSSWREILEGTVLSRTVLTFFQDSVGPDSADVLAAFSLGGDRGMGLEAVRSYLDLSRPQVRQKVSGLAAGGVLSETGRDALSVWPRQLRFALLRSVFFPGTAARLSDYQALLLQAPDLGSAVGTLVAAAAYGAKIPFQDLRNFIVNAGSRDAWQRLARLRAEDALWVLEHYEGDVVDVALGTLKHAPEATIDRLLERAEAATGPIHSQPSHPMRILSDWIRELDIPPDAMLYRRRLAARASKRYMERGGAASVGFHGICLALDPALEGSSLDPGSGRTITISWGGLPSEQLAQIESIWEEVRDAVREIDEVSWGHLSGTLWKWIYPQHAFRTTEVSGETVQAMHSFAARMLRDLVPLAKGHPGLAAGLKDLAGRIGVELPLNQELEFEQLYPPANRDLEEHLRREAQQQAALRSLALHWGHRNPMEVADQVARYEREAQRIGRRWPRNAPDLCREIAVATDEPEAWANAFLQVEVSGDLVSPFLEKIVKDRRQGWERHVERCLELDRSRWFAVELVLQLPSPPAHLLERALGGAGLYTQLVETLCLRNLVPVETLKALLKHPSSETALATAVGEWNSDPEGEVEPEVQDEWRAVILRAKSEESLEASSEVGLQYWLGVILAKDPELALDWLRTRLQDEDLPGWMSADGAFTQALSSLDQEQRLALLDELQPRPTLKALLPWLVHREPTVYQKLLTLKALADYHLDPLAGLPDSSWAEMAILALEAGYEARPIAGATVFGGRYLHSYAGPGIEHWSEWDQAFAALEGHPRKDLHEVARWGRRIAGDHLQSARVEERRIAVHGF